MDIMFCDAVRALGDLHPIGITHTGFLETLSLILSILLSLPRPLESGPTFFILPLLIWPSYVVDQHRFLSKLQHGKTAFVVVPKK